MVTDTKTFSFTINQLWSIISGVAVGVFVLTMIFARFISVEQRQIQNEQMFEEMLRVIESREIKKHNRQQEDIDKLKEYNHE